MKQIISKLFSRVAAVAAVALLTAATAWAETVQLTQSNLELTGSYTTNTEKTIGGITFVYTDLMKNSDNIQAKASSGEIHNKTAFPGDITSVAITHSGTARATTILGSSDGLNWTQVATGSGSITGDFSGKGYKYFKITRGSNAAYWTQIVITYSSPTGVATTTTIDDSGITNTDVYSSTVAGSLTASVKDNNNTAISGATVSWSGNNDEVATINTNTGAVTLVSEGIVTFTASYAGLSGQYLGSTGTYQMTVTDSSPGVKFDATKDTGTSPLVKDGVSFACSSGVLDNGTEYRLYKNSITTFSVTNGVIIGIAFTGVSGYPASGFASQDGWTTDGNNGTWAGNAKSVSFTASGAQVRATKIVVTVDPNGSVAPSITADDVNIAYNTTSGNIAYEIADPVSGGVVTASTTADWLTLGTVSDTAVPFTCTANSETTARTATVTLTYTYNTNETVTKEVTVTQAASPMIYSTIPALFNVATSTTADVNVTFDSWVVSGVSTNGKNVFVTDNAGNGFVIFNSAGGLSNDYSVGDILSGTAVSCKLVLYNGFAEITNLNASDLTVSSGGTVTMASIDMADLGGVNTGSLVSYDGLACTVDNSGNTTKYYLSDGTTTLQVYNALFAFDALEEGRVYNITGIYQQFNNTKEILPRSADDIEAVINPTIVVSPDLKNLTASAGDGTLAIVYENLPISDMSDFDIEFYEEVGGNTMGAPDWIEVLVAAQDPNVGEGYVVSYSVSKNEGDARSAFFRVYALDEEATEVYSNFVTINQAAPVIDYAKLPFEYDGNGTGTLPVGFTVSGLSTYSSSPKMQFNGTGDYAILKFNEVPGILTFDIKGNSFSGGTFTVQTSADGVNYSDLATYTELGSTQSVEFDNLSENARYIKWVYTNKVSGNVGLGNITLAKKQAAAPETYPLTLAAGDGGYWGTFYNGVAGYVLPDGAQAFTMNADKQLYRLGDNNARGKYIPANTAVVIISDVSEITLTKGESAESVSPNGGANILQGSDFSVAKTGNQYVLGKKNNVIGFFKFTGTSIPANKAYYVVSE